MAKLVFILLCLHFVATVYSKDATLISGSGEAVVDAVIDKIQSSCIFSNDKYFMKRIAAVETDFGKNMQTNSGGIWKIQPNMLIMLKLYCRAYVRSYCDAVLRLFNIDMKILTYKDMDVPLKSALVMRTYLQTYLVYISASKSSQAWLWSKIISKKHSNEFLDKATLKPACFYPKMDLIFAIDASNSVGQRNFKKTLSFLKDVVGGLEIGSDFVRVAVIRYASGTEVSISLDQYNNVMSMKQKIDTIQYTGGDTNTAAALNLASTTFTSDRPNVPKVVVLITNGYSNNVGSTINAANKLKGDKIIIFTIGIGRVRDWEMLRVASAPSCTHFFKLFSYSEIDSIIHQIQRKACESAITVDGNATDTFIRDNKLPPDNKAKVQRLIIDPSNNNNVKNTIRVDVVCGVVNVYTSSTSPRPNAALYHAKSTATEGISAWIHSDPTLKVYISFISERRTDLTNPHCANPHYNISVNPTNIHIDVICRENGVNRQCSDGDIKEAFKHLFADTNQPIILNPCTNVSIVNNIMRHPHPNFRNMFLQCKVTGEMEIVTCSAGTNYNEQQSVCSPYVAPPSSGGPYAGPNPCTNKAMVGGYFYFTNPTDQTSFIQCTENGIPLRVLCPTGTVWSQKAYTCIDKTVASYNPCNSSTNVYFYPNPGNKATYIRCDDYDNAYLMLCPDTTVWSQDKQICIVSSQPVSNKCVNPCTTGQYCPFPGDPNFYYFCNHQTLIKMPCSSGLVWSQSLKSCVPP